MGSADTVTRADLDVALAALEVRLVKWAVGIWACPGQGSEADRTDYAASPEAAYDGSRWNDLHYTRAAKERARRSPRTSRGI